MATHQDADSTDNRLAQLKIRTEKMEHWARWIGILLKLPLLAVWLLLFIGLGVMVRNATRMPGIVIDSILVPPTLSEGEPSGEAIASMMRTRITQMRTTTIERSTNSRNIGHLVTDWAADYRVPIPQTGTTIGELASTLRRWLGSDTRVSGAISREGDRRHFVINVAAKDRPVMRRRLTDRSFHVLVEQAAEEVFNRTDPYLYAIYLRVDQNRNEESNQRLISLAINGLSGIERAQAMNGLAANLIELHGRCREATPILDAARRLNRHLSDVYRNLSNAYYCLGQDQQAADAAAEAIFISWRDEHEMDARQIARNRLWDLDNLAGSYGNYRLRLALSDARQAWGDSDRSRSRAEALAELRDVTESRVTVGRYCAMAWPGSTSCANNARYWFVRFKQAWALDDWRAAVRFLRTSNRLYGNHPYARQQLATQTLPLEAMALARSGNVRQARNLLRALPDDCYLCARGRAIVAAAAGEQQEADRLFRDAADLAPRLPFAYAEWGQARLRRGEAAEALRLFDLARVHAPEFADAYKGRGEALALLDRQDEAATAYEAAAQRAPRWGGLHLRWAWALARLRRADDAREKTCAAAGMDLSRADRVLLTRWMERARLTC